MSLLDALAIWLLLALVVAIALGKYFKYRGGGQ